MNELILLGIPIFIIVAYYIVFEFPEISYALFLTAGVYKADPRLSFLPSFLDLTVFFGICSVVGVIYKLLKKNIKIVLPPIRMFVPFILIELIALISLGYTMGPIYGTDKLLRFSTITALSFFLPLFLFQRVEVLRRFFKVFIFLGIAMIIDIISGGLKPEEIEFHSAFGSNYLAVGRIVGFALIPIILYFLLNTKSNLIKFFYIILIPFMLFGIFISGGRGPVVAFLISIFFSFLYLNSFILRRVLQTYTIKKEEFKIISVFILLITLIIGIFLLFSSYFVTLIHRVELLTSGGGASLLKRLDLYNKAIEVLSTFPRNLIGLGIGGFNVYYGNIDSKRGIYPHNIFLEIGSELGVLGLILLVLLIFFTFYSTICKIKKKTSLEEKSLYNTILSLLIFMLINSLISGDINDNRLLFTTIGISYSMLEVIRERK